jgi:predicted  nucleic acid-binding Zn-ribbon protein
VTDRAVFFPSHLAAARSSLKGLSMAFLKNSNSDRLETQLKDAERSLQGLELRLATLRSDHGAAVEKRRAALLSDELDNKLLAKLDSAVASIESGMAGCEDACQIASNRIIDIAARLDQERVRVEEEADARRRQAVATKIEQAYASFLPPLADLIAALREGDIHETDQAVVLLDGVKFQLEQAVPVVIGMIKNNTRPRLSIVREAG